MATAVQPISDGEFNAVGYQDDEQKEKPICLQVRLRKETYSLPYFRFVFCKGTNDKLVITFATHAVIIQGRGLDTLQNWIAANRVHTIVQPTENEGRFQHGPGITDVEVKELL